MGLEINYIEGQTPLDPDEKEGLLIKSILMRQELDEFEQLNIEKAFQKYLLQRKFKQQDILTEKFILTLHKEMFGDVWQWAGKYRKSNKNIGIDKLLISTQLRQLIDDCKYWIDNAVFDDDEIAIQFKHRLVSIHLFPNGNGRHSRIMADIMMRHIFKKPIFSWGTKDLTRKGKNRDRYIKALKKADNGDIESLKAFANS